jgi:hypothetical protein
VKKESNRIEKKSILITVIIQTVLLFGLFFTIAWKEPNPPIPQYGLELGFELFNDTEKVSANQRTESPTEDDQIVQEKSGDNEIVRDESIESKEIFESSEELQNDIINEKETDQIISSSETMLQSEVETVAIPDELAQVVEDEETMPEVGEEVEPKDSAAKNIKNKDNVISQNSLLADSLSELKDKLNRADHEKGTSNQNDKIDDRALYKTNSGSNKGTNEGPELQISGWTWGTQKPRPMDTSDEIVGKVICNIRVDSDGYISAQLDSYTTPSSVAVAYKNSLDGLQLEVKEEGVTLGSMGKVIFILKPKVD